ncbi:Lrp/AsnC family transcriptional regulator [Fertoebacter nigrum]|uniref:Lrp/AsnC family transcriptional regulator n=1 Tax=Fertoeibacter niger TaxID=2656921 RepID=A0A8X8H1W0_9RHOB|nr:Lrp/AsnC family transcriptional regulator [Fertoeibacter niger]NUB44657.1 Lrp/AsnC family transcriptional regulator [Fertoeibacter niger]
MPQAPLDDADKRLLRQLQRDARISTQDLADRAGLSASPAWRRVKRMEDAGLIRKHVAMLDPKRLGLSAVAYVHVSLLDHSEPTMARFDDFVQHQDQVVECASITGSDDYLLKVYARDPEDLERFIMRKLLALGIVRSSTTNFVLRQTKYTTELPLD